MVEGYRFEILDIQYINGERTPIDHQYRKTKFTSKDDMEAYQKYLEKKLDKQLFLTYKDYTK